MKKKIEVGVVGIQNFLYTFFLRIHKAITTKTKSFTFKYDAKTLRSDFSIYSHHIQLKTLFTSPFFLSFSFFFY